MTADEATESEVKGRRSQGELDPVIIMARAASESKPMYQKDEKALCFHGELLYEAKVLEIRRQDAKDKTSPYEYRVHYKGWKNT